MLAQWCETPQWSCCIVEQCLEYHGEGLAGKSNSGEGGEDPVRWDVMQNVSDDGVSPSLPHLKGLQNGDMATSRIKQARRQEHLPSDILLARGWTCPGYPSRCYV